MYLEILRLLAKIRRR
ncbi:MAG: hypothetical protein AB1476_04610 [Candidatus Hadarchaeota archaeon]